MEMIEILASLDHQKEFHTLYPLTGHSEVLDGSFLHECDECDSVTTNFTQAQ